jgi:hypothetical protein
MAEPKGGSSSPRRGTAVARRATVGGTVGSSTGSNESSA